MLLPTKIVVFGIITEIILYYFLYITITQYQKVVLRNVVAFKIKIFRCYQPTVRAKDYVCKDP